MLWAERFSVLFERELKMRISYRMSLILGVTSSLSGLLVYGLLGNSASASITSQSDNMSLASYLVSGVAFSGIIMNGPAMFSQHASASELEEVLVTPTGFREFLLSSSALNTLTTIGGAAGFFLLGAFLLGLDYSYNPPLLVLMVLLGLLSSIGLGFMSSNRGYPFRRIHLGSATRWPLGPKLWYEVHQAQWYPSVGLIH